MVVAIGEERESKNNEAGIYFFKEQPERDLDTNCQHLHVNMQIAVCAYNVETKHLIRLDLIHLSPLCCKHLRGYWIQSQQNAFDLYSTDCDYFSYKL